MFLLKPLNERKNMFISHNRVRMHDTDMAGILYFPRQFRFVHDCLEDLMQSEGITYQQIFHHEKFVFVVIHAESDYLSPLTVGEDLEIHLATEKIGNTSFTLGYNIFRKRDKKLVGKAKTVHVTLDAETRNKIPLPKKLIKILSKYPSDTLEQQNNPA